jgi:hypothetical protein
VLGTADRAEVDLARVDAGGDVQAERLNRLADAQRRKETARWTQRAAPRPTATAIADAVRRGASRRGDDRDRQVEAGGRG